MAVVETELIATVAGTDDAAVVPDESPDALTIFIVVVLVVVILSLGAALVWKHNHHSKDDDKASESESDYESDDDDVEKKLGCGPPQHGLSSNKMARITSDCGKMRHLSIKWA